MASSNSFLVEDQQELLHFFLIGKSKDVSQLLVQVARGELGAGKGDNTVVGMEQLLGPMAELGGLALTRIARHWQKTAVGLAEPLKGACQLFALNEKLLVVLLLRIHVAQIFRGIVAHLFTQFLPIGFLGDVKRRQKALHPSIKIGVPLLRDEGHSVFIGRDKRHIFILKRLKHIDISFIIGMNHRI